MGMNPATMTPRRSSASAPSPTVFTLVLDDLLTRFAEYGASSIRFKLTATSGTTGFVYLDQTNNNNPGLATGLIASVLTIEQRIHDELEALTGYSGKVTVSGAETNAGDTYTFTITFDASLGAVTLDFGDAQWYPTITLTEAVTQQGVATVTGVAEVVTITVGADGLSDVNFSGIGSVTFDVVAGVFNGDVPITGWTITAGGDTQTSVTYTRNSTGAIADPSLVGGDLGISVDVQGVDAVTGQPEIHTITPTPVNPTGGAWHPYAGQGGSGSSYSITAASLQTIYNAALSPDTVTVTESGSAGISDGFVTVTWDANKVIADDILSPVNVDLTAPEIMHSIG